VVSLHRDVNGPAPGAHADDGPGTKSGIGRSMVTGRRATASGRAGWIRGGGLRPCRAGTQRMRGGRPTPSPAPGDAGANAAQVRTGHEPLGEEEAGVSAHRRAPAPTAAPDAWAAPARRLRQTARGPCR